MAYPYRGRLPWPFPALPIVVYNDDRVAISPTLTALVDTGADTTLVPAHVLEQGKAEVLRTARIRSHWGEFQVVTLYLVDLALAGEHLGGIEVVADKGSDEVILGRNVLNKVILLLDGPQQQIDLLTRRPRRL